MRNVTIKNMPRLRLVDLLRRRKVTFEAFIEESGLQTYVALVNMCTRIGVQPPSEEEYREICPRVVSSPSDGVVVLEPIKEDPLPEEIPEMIDTEGSVPAQISTLGLEPVVKKRRKKKQETPE